MTERSKPSPYRIIALVGVSDVVLGLALAAAGHFDLLGEGLEILVPFGAIVAVIGVGMALWGRHKMNHAASRGGWN